MKTKKLSMFALLFAWTASACLAIAIMLPVAARPATTPNCDFGMESRSCGPGCDPVPTAPASIICFDYEGGCCNGLCTVNQCRPNGDDVECAFWGNTTWEGTGSFHANYNCPGTEPVWVNCEGTAGKNNCVPN